MAVTEKTHPQGARFIIIGASTLLGKEVKELLEERYPSAAIRLLDDNSVLGQLEEAGGEATFIQSVIPENFLNAEYALFASTPAFTAKHWSMARAAGCSIIDLSCGLLDVKESGIQLYSTWLGPGLQKNRPPDIALTGVASPHPAALMLSLLLSRAAQAGDLQSSTGTLFRPLSDIGKYAMDELHQQTIQLVSFKPLPKDYFDEQLAFNLLAQYGGEAKLTMKEFVLLLQKQMRTLLPTEAMTPALQVVQAPLFHGQTLSLYLEYKSPVQFHAMVEALSGEHVQIVPPDEPVPNNVSTVGLDEIQVSIRADAARPGGFWLWAVADNLRIASLAALDCIKYLAISRPSGNIQ